MFVKLLNLQGEDIENFADINSNKYYSSYVSIAKKHKIIRGWKNNFNPEDNISRQDMMIIIANILKKFNIKVDTNQDGLLKFKDYSNISDYAKESMAIVVNNGIVVGYTNNTINPKKPISRAEIAVVTSKLYDILSKNNII